MRHRRNPTPELKRKLSAVANRTCGASKKIMFASHEAAMTRAAEIMAEDSSVAGFRSYKCPNCGQWHLTSQL